MISAATSMASSSVNSRRVMGLPFLSRTGFLRTILSQRAFVREWRRAPPTARARKVGWSLTVDLTMLDTGLATVRRKSTPNLRNRDMYAVCTSPQHGQTDEYFFDAWCPK